MSVMSERAEFVVLALADGANVSALCRRFGVSRKTGYKWLSRYATEGSARLADQSRRPLEPAGRALHWSGAYWSCVSSIRPGAVATQLDSLTERGLLDSTLVAVVAEFSRTPKINKDAGRDHWSDVFSVILTGGGLQTGQAFGTGNPRAESPQDRPIHYNDILATIYRQLGIVTD